MYFHRNNIILGAYLIKTAKFTKLKRALIVNQVLVKINCDEKRLHINVENYCLNLQQCLSKKLQTRAFDIIETICLPSYGIYFKCREASKQIEGPSGVLN
jgi:hypothetical protein